MQYVIWVLLAIFCLIPPVVAQKLLSHEEKEGDPDKLGGDAS